MKKPKNFALIIGSMKCGTTYLYDLVLQHPKILGCLEKEPSFFSNSIGLESNWEKGIKYYDSLWPDWNPEKHKYALEASVNYTKIPAFPNAAERIATIKDRNFKFIYIIRNPLERIRSHISFMTVYWRRKGKFDEDVSAHAHEISKYAMQLDEYAQRFGKENILILQFEDFVKNPQKIVNQVFAFLELSPYDVTLQGEKNVTSEQAFRPIVHKIRNLIPSSISFKKILPKFILNLIKDRTVSKFKLSPEQEQRITSELRNDILRLKSEYDVNIERWNIKL